MRRLKKILIVLVALTTAVLTSPEFTLEPQEGDSEPIVWSEFAGVLSNLDVQESWEEAGYVVSKFIRQQMYGVEVQEEEEVFDESGTANLEALDLILATLPLAAEFIADGKMRGMKAMAKARRARNLAKMAKLLAKQAAAASANILGIFDLMVNTVVLVLQITMPFFDPADKEPVPEGMASYDQLPVWAKVFFENIPLGVGSIMDLILPIVQFGQKCPEGFVYEGGLCYKPCRPGFESDGAAMCYKQYPEFEGNGLLHTLTNITKKVLTNTGTPPTDCGGGDYDAGLCYAPCRAGYVGRGPVCWADVEDVGAGTMPKLFRKECYDGREYIDGLCYANCPPGKERVPGMPYLCRAVGEVSYTRSAGTVPKCSAGKTEDSAGLCYDAAPAGFEKQSLGLVSQVCPPGSTDFGVGCLRESYAREGKFPFVAEIRPTRAEVVEADRLLG
jgi:hypothetical protein